MSDTVLDIEQATTTILLVDDDPNLGAAMQRNFRGFDVELIVATHGTQGMMEAVAKRPDVIITDLQMPHVSGEKLIEFLAGNPMLSGVPIFVISGRWGAKMTSRMKRCGVVDVLTKPVDFEMLVERLSGVATIPKYRLNRQSSYRAN
ncbi:MAG: response regulator [Aureliella sp.]